MTLKLITSALGVFLFSPVLAPRSGGGVARVRPNFSSLPSIQLGNYPAQSTGCAGAFGGLSND